jgi:hypothetical protein
LLKIKERMVLYYKILSYCGAPGEIIVPKHLFLKFDFINWNYATIHAGLKNIKVKVKPSKEDKVDVVKISSDVIEQLLLPKDILYQLKIEGTSMYIGPIIGLLFTKNEYQLTNWKLNKSLEYTSIYPQIKGLMCLFSLEGIDFENCLIHGYYYKSGKYENGGYWVKRRLPLPDIIFRRGEIGRLEETKLKQITKNKMFNSYYFNKWTFWHMASNSETIKSYIPDTCLLNSLGDLDFMLEKHKTVYLKQMHGSKAKGLVKVTKEEHYSFLTNENPYPVEIESKIGAVNYIKRLTEEKPYIIQQAINSLKLQDRTVDFRVIVQKNQRLSWKCTAIISKIGKINGICSNFTESGYALKFKQALLSTTFLNKKEIKNKKLQLKDVCIKVCKELDKLGENFGDVAIDVALDTDLNIWILEVNKEHNYNVLLDIYSYEKYIDAKANPIRYAMGLTKFKK